MMKLTVPAKQKSFRTSKIYYVTSESKPDETHIVIRIGSTISPSFFCDCRDFMIRRLSETVANSWRGAYTQPCKHGKFVQDVENSIGYGEEVISAFRGDIRTVPNR